MSLCKDLFSMFFVIGVLVRAELEFECFLKLNLNEPKLKFSVLV